MFWSQLENYLPSIFRQPIGDCWAYPHHILIFLRQITRGYSNGNPSPIPQAISEKNLLGRLHSAGIDVFGSPKMPNKWGYFTDRNEDI